MSEFKMLKNNVSNPESCFHYVTLFLIRETSGINICTLIDYIAHWNREENKCSMFSGSAVETHNHCIRSLLPSIVLPSWEGGNTNVPRQSRYKYGPDIPVPQRRIFRVEGTCRPWKAVQGAADTMEIKSAGCVIGVIVTLLSICFSQPVIPNYYYSGKLNIVLLQCNAG